MKRIILFLILSFFIKFQAYALYATVSGPSDVCPFTMQRYELRVYADVGIPINSYTFDMLPPVGLYRGNVPEGSATLNKVPNSNLTYIDVQFVDPGDLQIRLSVRGGIPVSSHLVVIPVSVGYPPVVEPVIPDNYACAGSTKAVSVNNLESAECFHHQVEWGLPSGWSISPQSGTNYNLSVPANTAPGAYTVSTRGVYDDRGNAVSPWVHKTIRVGSPTPPVIIAPEFAGI